MHIDVYPCDHPHSTAGAYVCVFSDTPSFNLNKTGTVNNLQCCSKMWLKLLHPHLKKTKQTQTHWILRSLEPEKPLHQEPFPSRRRVFQAYLWLLSLQDFLHKLCGGYQQIEIPPSAKVENLLLTKAFLLCLLWSHVLQLPVINSRWNSLAFHYKIINRSNGHGVILYFMLDYLNVQFHSVSLLLCLHPQLSSSQQMQIGGFFQSTYHTSPINKK